MALASAPTLIRVATTKRVPGPELMAFARTLEKFVQERHGGNQTAAAKDLGITQGHISAMTRGERGPGLNTLLKLREKTGQSIDLMLGLHAPPGEDLFERLRATFELEVARARQQVRDAQEEVRILKEATRPPELRTDYTNVNKRRKKKAASE